MADRRFLPPATPCNASLPISFRNRVAKAVVKVIGIYKKQNSALRRRASNTFAFKKWHDGVAVEISF
jgi:hypothetical protein